MCIRDRVCIQSEPDGKPTNIVCPADALEDGVQPLIDFLKSKNPNCKVCLLYTSPSRKMRPRS